MTEQTRANTNRVATIRRLYLYLIAFISLVGGLTAARDLINTLAQLWLASDTLLDVNPTGFARDAIARQGGFLIVSAPVFLVHWRFIRRLAAQPASLRQPCASCLCTECWLSRAPSASAPST